MTPHDLDHIRWLPLTSADADRVAQLAGAALAPFPWVLACWLHGSLVRGDRPPRDLDFGVLTGRQFVPWAQWEQARCAIGAALGMSPDVVDLRPVDDGSPVFLGNLLAHGRLCCEANRAARVDFEVRATSLWCDFRPVWEQQRAAALASWANGSDRPRGVTL